MEQLLPIKTLGISVQEPSVVPGFRTQFDPDGDRRALEHDARNLLAALGLYCDLLEEPQVLNPNFRHYAKDLRLIFSAMQHMVDRFETSAMSRNEFDRPDPDRVENLAAEIKANRELMVSLAGPQIHIEVRTYGCSLPIALSREELTRILVNLVRNAVDALPAGGNIWIEAEPAPSAEPRLLLTVSDNGHGIPPETLPLLFEAGYSTHLSMSGSKSGYSSPHRGLGLAIVRNLVEATGGFVRAGNRPEGGAFFVLELPVAESRFGAL